MRTSYAKATITIIAVS